MRHRPSRFSHFGQKQKLERKKRKPCRSKIQIYGDLLRIIDAEANSGKIILTRIQVKIDVPFDRLKNYLAELKMLALIEEGKTFKVTKKGKEYLQEYESVLDFMQRMNCKSL